MTCFQILEKSFLSGNKTHVKFWASILSDGQFMSHIFSQEKGNCQREKKQQEIQYNLYGIEITHGRT